MGTATTASRSDHVHEGDGAGGGSFDLHDDVTTAISTLDDNDRFVVSDENLSGDPNRYVTLAAVATKLAGTGLTASAGVLSASGGGGGGDGDGVVTITPRTESAHNFSFNGTIQSGQERDLFDTNITLPDGLASDETFVIRVNATHGYAEIVLSQALLEELDTESPVTWSTSATGVAAVNSGDSQKRLLHCSGAKPGRLCRTVERDPPTSALGLHPLGRRHAGNAVDDLDCGFRQPAGGRGRCPIRRSLGAGTNFDETTIDGAIWYLGDSSTSAVAGIAPIGRVAPLSGGRSDRTCTDGVDDGEPSSERR